MTYGIEILLLAHSANIGGDFDSFIACQGYAFKAWADVRLESYRLDETLDFKKRGGYWREQIVWSNCCGTLFGTHYCNLSLRGCIVHNFAQGILLNSFKIEIWSKSC
jgi:hypothetical protein